MKINNKGFAITTVLYSLTAVLVLSLFLILSVLSNIKKNNDKITDDIRGQFINNVDTYKLNNIDLPVMYKYDAKWVRIFHHNHKNFQVLFNDSEVGLIDTPNKQSVLSLIEQFRKQDGYFEFLIQKNMDTIDTWVQRENPYTEVENPVFQPDYLLSKKLLKSLSPSTYSNYYIKGENVTDPIHYIPIGLKQAPPFTHFGPSVMYDNWNTIDLWVRVEDDVRVLKDLTKNNKNCHIKGDFVRNYSHIPEENYINLINNAYIECMHNYWRYPNILLSFTLNENVIDKKLLIGRILGGGRVGWNVGLYIENNRLVFYYPNSDYPYIRSIHMKSDVPDLVPNKLYTVVLRNGKGKIDLNEYKNVISYYSNSEDFSIWYNLKIGKENNANLNMKVHNILVFNKSDKLYDHYFNNICLLPEQRNEENSITMINSCHNTKIDLKNDYYNRYNNYRYFQK